MSQLPQWLDLYNASMAAYKAGDDGHLGDAGAARRKACTDRLAFAITRFYSYLRSCAWGGSSPAPRRWPLACGGRPRACAPATGSTNGVMFISRLRTKTSSRTSWYGSRCSKSIAVSSFQPAWARVGEVLDLVAHRLTDLSANLASVGGRDPSFPLPRGRGDEFHHGSPGLDPRCLPKGPRPRNVVDPYGHIDQIQVKRRDFR